MSYSRAALEAALDAGKLRYRAPNGNLWKVRRGGKTTTKGTSYRIPVVAGFQVRDELTTKTAKSFVIEA